jgi:hypothetical protein
MKNTGYINFYRKLQKMAIFEGRARPFNKKIPHLRGVISKIKRHFIEYMLH